MDYLNYCARIVFVVLCHGNIGQWRHTYHVEKMCWGKKARKQLHSLMKH